MAPRVLYVCEEPFAEKKPERTVDASLISRVLENSSNTKNGIQRTQTIHNELDVRRRRNKFKTVTILDFLLKNYYED